MDGPKMSVSRIPVRRPRRAKARERLAAMVDLPTPPFAEDTARMWATLGMGRLVGRPRWKRGMLPLAGRPWGCEKGWEERCERATYKRVLMA
jgi:hypothetical protein